MTDKITQRVVVKIEDIPEGYNALSSLARHGPCFTGCGLEGFFHLTIIHGLQ